MNEKKALYALAPNEEAKEYVYKLVNEISDATGYKTFYVYLYAIEMYWRSVFENGSELFDQQQQQHSGDEWGGGDAF